MVATTGIKCVGNTVVLHGVPYSPPYRITAIGPTDDMLTSVTTSPYIAAATCGWSPIPASAGTSRRTTRSACPATPARPRLEYAKPAA